MNKYFIPLILSLCFSNITFADVGNIEAGKAKSAMCAGCHGVDGNSLVPIYPKLSGQNTEYLIKQLVDFQHAMTSGGKEGRVDPVMGGVSMALTSQDISDLAAYYNSQKISMNKTQGSDLGKKIYQGGSAELEVTACIACHGINAKGMPKAGFPALASQNEDYLKNQMMKFKKGTRANDNNAMMRNIAIKLEDEQIAALAKYISSLK